MSRQRSLEQERAREAWDCVEQVRSCNEELEERKRYAKEYNSLARSAPADIQGNGLGQTLAFWRAKGFENGKPKDNGDNAHCQLFAHASARIRRQLSLPEARDVVEWIAKEATTEEYRRATTEAMAFLIWLKRFAEAELPTGE